MPGCKVNQGASTDFKKLKESWRRSYPHIDSDLTDAFTEIEKNILANHGRRTLGGPRFDLYKYRQNSSDIKRGARYGWRIYCLFDRQTGTMYPIIVYPKTALADADTKSIIEGMAGIKVMLGQCVSPECDGELILSQPKETASIGGVMHDKLKCQKCKTVAWRISPEPQELASETT